MVDIAPHIRIFENSPSDEFVTKRRSSVKDLAGKFVKPYKLSRVFSIANGLTLATKEGGALQSQLAGEVSASIAKYSSAFVAEGHELELLTCAMLAAVQAIENAPKSEDLSAQDHLAAGIWLGFAWQPTNANERLERLRELLLDVSRSHVLKVAELGRERQDLPEQLELAADNANLSNVLKNIQLTNSTLASNAIVDREEIDLLWWSISGWSDVLGAKYADARPHAAAIALGLDAAKRLRHMPMEVHKSLILRRLPSGEKLTLSGVIDALADDCALLGKLYKEDSDVTSNPYIFPLLNSLASGSDVAAAGTREFSLADLAVRALLEAVTADVITRSGV
jgi:hypothetical protein